MKNKILYWSFLAALLLSVFVSVSVMDANAQTTRRKRTTGQRPVPSPTPPIDRNAEYVDGNQIVLGELPQNEPTNEVVTQSNVVPTVEQTESEARIKELTRRIKSLEAGKRNEYDEKQKRLLLNLDILSRAESRAESLRKQLYELIEKEATVRTRLEQVQADARPEMIERSTAFVGSLRPEEIREQRRKSLEAERRNLESLLTQIQNNRLSLEDNVTKADLLVEKVRLKLDKEIDDALTDKEENQ